MKELMEVALGSTHFLCQFKGFMHAERWPNIRYGIARYHW